MAVYRIKLFTSKSVHNVTDKMACINDNYIAIGWPINTASDFENYCEIAKSHPDYSVDGNLNAGLKVSLNVLKKLEIGDLVWTQVDGLDYRLGKVTGECEVLEDLGPARKCEWKKVDFSYVPGDIISRFVGRGYVLCRVRCSDGIETYCKHLYENEKTTTINSVKELLHYDDLEDLAGLYLQEEKKYYIIPSTNKQGAKDIEYELRDKQGNKACIQCKIGKGSVDIAKLYKDFQGYKIYICVLDENQRGSYTNKEKNIEEITFDELLKWAKKHKEILPDRIQNYISLMQS